jgi:hypothetical protein
MNDGCSSITVSSLPRPTPSLRSSDPEVSSIRANTVRRLARMNHDRWLLRLRVLEADGTIRVETIARQGVRLRSVTIFYRGSVRDLVVRFRGVDSVVSLAGLPSPCPSCGSDVTSHGNVLWCRHCRRGYLPSRPRGLGIGIA